MVDDRIGRNRTTLNLHVSHISIWNLTLEAGVGCSLLFVGEGFIALLD